MPGLVIASRRWIIGSDDLVIPGGLLSVAHLIWVIIYTVVCINNGTIFLHPDCSPQMTYHILGQLILLSGCASIEICTIKISMQGSILNPKARHLAEYILYIRTVLFVLEVIWEGYGFYIFFSYWNHCSFAAKEIIIVLKIFNFFVWILIFIILWCAFDPAGYSWVKMKKFQNNLKESKYKYRRSKNSHRNWRYREAIREYEKSWQNRCRKACCIINLQNPGENSFAEVAKLLSEFFRDLDVVPSDVVAGLSLMRVQQKALRMETMEHVESTVYQYLSGVPITAVTEFLDLSHPLVMKEIANLVHYLHYSLAIYGWPMYMMANTPTDWCKLLNHTKCSANSLCNASSFGCFGNDLQSHLAPDTIVDDHYTAQMVNADDIILGDNCCLCNRAAIQQTCIEHNYKLVYITYQVGVEKPPFFVAVDYEKMSIVVSIRGTLSLYDVLTDLKAEYEILPLQPSRDDWFGHKGMVAAAIYIRSKLIDGHLLNRCNEELRMADPQPGVCLHYPIIVVGHSLGAGTAAILTILLKQTYHNVLCFAFAPPGGLLSEPAAEYSKDFVISIVLGKDIVPRLGLHQMEKMRLDLIKTIKRCHMAKWRVIVESCCLGSKDIAMPQFMKQFHMSPMDDNDAISEDDFKKLSIHPSDASISLTVHTPLYPPGTIIHLVRMHPTKPGHVKNKKEFIIQAVWASFRDFNEILVSPTMIKDHMPDRMLQALNCLLNNTGPQKPDRVPSTSSSSSENQSKSNSSNGSNSVSPRVLVETSFTSEVNHLSNDRVVDSKYRLSRLRSLIRKFKAPLATPETISLSSHTDLSEVTQEKCEKMNKNSISSSAKSVTTNNHVVRRQPTSSVINNPAAVINVDLSAAEVSRKLLTLAPVELPNKMINIDQQHSSEQPSVGNNDNDPNDDHEHNKSSSSAIDSKTMNKNDSHLGQVSF